MSLLAGFFVFYFLPSLAALALSFTAKSWVARHFLRWPAVFSLIFLAFVFVYLTACTRTDESLYGTYYDCVLVPEEVGGYLPALEVMYAIVMLFAAPVLLLFAGVGEWIERSKTRH